MCDSYDDRMSPDHPTIPGLPTVNIEVGRASSLSGHIDMKPSIIVPPTLMHQSPSDQPKDLSMKRKMKPVPPPLDLSKRTLDTNHHVLLNHHQYLQHHIQHQSADLRTSSPSPKSPFMQKNLPLRKRAHSWSFQPGILTSTTSASSINSALSSTITTIKDEEYEETSEDYNKSSSNSSLRFAGLPTPHTPQTPHPHSAIPVLTSKFNFSEGNMQSTGPLNLSTGGGLPSSLLSPAPSHPSMSSLSSSREELEPEAMMTESYGHHHLSYHGISQPSHHHLQHPHLYHSSVYGSSSKPQICTSPLHQNDDRFSSASSTTSSSHYADVENMTPSSAVYMKEEHNPQSLYTKAELSSMSSVLYTQPEETHADEDSNSSGMFVNEEIHCLSPASKLYDIKDEDQHQYAAEAIHEESMPYQYSPALASRYSDATADTDRSNTNEEIPYIATTSNLQPWPQIVWSIFMPGVRVHFVLRKDMDTPPQVTYARLSEELATLEKETTELYAPKGLHLFQCLTTIQINKLIPNSSEGDASTAGTTAASGSNGEDHLAHLYLRPVNSAQEDIIALTPSHHPFYVREKGWCSVNPELCRKVYGVACSLLTEGDVCIPPSINDAVGSQQYSTRYQTPSSAHSADCVADAMRRFDFNDDPQPSYDRPLPLTKLSPVTEVSNNSPTIGGGIYSPSISHHHHLQSPPTPAHYTSSTTIHHLTPHSNRTVAPSPPASPSKKSAAAHARQGQADGNAAPQTRPRRPMNGFMLFAKTHRLKLIQQYPGKDNRAISVLLGATWKSLPEHERERINAEARIQAEARKRLDPDCWKRKRSHSTS